MTEEMAERIITTRKKKKIKKIEKIIPDDIPYGDIVKNMFIVKKEKIEVEGIVNYKDILRYGGALNYRQSTGKDFFLLSTSVLCDSAVFDQNRVSFSLYGIKQIGFILGDYRIFSNTGLSFAGRSLLSKTIGDLNNYDAGVSPFMFYPSWRRLRGGSVFFNLGFLKMTVFGGMTLRKGSIENDSIISFSYSDHGENFYQYNGGGCLNLNLNKSEIDLLFNRFYYQYPIKGEDFDLRGKTLDNFSLGYSFNSTSIDADIEVVKGKGVGMDSKMNLKIEPIFTGIEIKYLGDTLFLPYGLNYGIKDKRETKSISYYIYYSNKFLKSGFDIKVSDTVNLTGNIRIKTDYGSIYGSISNDYFYSYLKIFPFKSRVLNTKIFQKYNDNSFVYGISVSINYFLNLRAGIYKHKGEKSLSLYVPSPYPFSSSASLDQEEYIVFTSISYGGIEIFMSYPEKEISAKVKISF